MLNNFKLNNVQLVTKLSTARHKVLVAGRGVGKTTMIAEELLDLLRIFPRGKAGLIGMTYYHIKTKSMPVIIKHWEKRGFIKDVHYFVGRKPPKNWKWPEAYMPPLDYTHSIIFWNGFTIEFISMDRPEVARSGNYDFQIGDEAAKISAESLQSDIMPARRGNLDVFGHINKHLGSFFCTTHALSIEGEWVYKYEDLAKQDANYFYLEASAIANKANLGDAFFNDNARMMSKALYDLEILNIRPLIKSDSFYPKFNYETHTYVPEYNYNLLDSNPDVEDSRKDLDCNTNQALDLSFDFGSKINCAVIGQQKSIDEYRLINNIFLLAPQIISDLVAKFINYYRHHQNKTVFLYGGSDGARRTDYDSLHTYYDKIIDQLAANGWKCIQMYDNKEIDHKEKFIFFTELYSNTNPALPSIQMNQENFKEGIISIRNAPLKKTEIKKDKSSEKKDIEQWQATHLSDAKDNLLYHKFSHAGRATQGNFMPTRIS